MLFKKFSLLDNKIFDDIDVVIIGAGVAGITLGLELEELGNKVLVFEGGDLVPSAESQRLYEGVQTGLKWEYNYLTATRNRYFGGTSNSWAGYCGKFEHDDVESWPIKYDELYKHSEKAENILELKPFNAGKDSYLSDAKNFSKHKLSILRKSPPVRFAKKYHDHIFNSDNFHVVLNSNLVDASLKNGRIDSIKIMDYTDEVLEVRPKKLVFSMGAIENTRYMLYLKQKYDLLLPTLGERFMEHPHYDWDDYSAYLICKKDALKDIGFNNISSHNEIDTDEKNQYYISPTKALKNDLNILNYGFTLFRRESSDELIPNEVETIKKFSRYLGVQINCENDYDLFIVNLQTEMDPVKDNKLFLDKAKKDMFGIPLINLNINATEKLKSTVFNSIKALAFDFMKKKCIVFRANHSPASFNGGAHPIGTTMMGLDNMSGVVDNQLKVFGVDNLYITGGSVFPTSGYVNPTFTIVCMTLRLAHTLNRIKS